MKIDHVAMYVRDLEAVKDFFVRFFDAVSNEMYHNPRTGLKSYFLSFGNGAKLEIMTRPDLSDLGKDIYCTGYIHLSFSVGSEEQVNSLTAKLQSAGYEVISGPRLTGDGFYESCVLDSEHNQIEITV
ncbi:VOC family protein [Paraprevotella clara]|uniref:Glyoxalase family protein n=1 Tax=Paraprevotella clara YIT 11840 TaxID=762968 RepID=G5SQ99_9BACT|nr:VOC family protein [Paraprevotella clara]EHH00302.1 glyoxalase family protein [Paraprevotella clara YIT 11840]